jgi:hypothetical protein
METSKDLTKSERRRDNNWTRLKKDVHEELMAEYVEFFEG